MRGGLRPGPGAIHSIVALLEGRENWDSEYKVPELRRQEAEASSKSNVGFAGWGQILMICL